MNLYRAFRSSMLMKLEFFCCECLVRVIYSDRLLFEGQIIIENLNKSITADDLSFSYLHSLCVRAVTVSNG
jgi:hypothetical protein